MALGSLLLTAIAVGCGGAQMKERTVDDVTASMRAASEVGAEDVPQAALYLHLAQEGMDEYKALSAKGDAKSAQLALERAQLDADLALQLAQTQRHQAAALAARTKVQELKRDSQ
jgi:hypothetical protein